MLAEGDKKVNWQGVCRVVAGSSLHLGNAFRALLPSLQEGIEKAKQGSLITKCASLASEETR